MLTNKLQSQPTVEGGCNARDERGAYSGRVCLGSEQRLVASDELWRRRRRELAAPHRQCIQLRDQRHLTVTTGLRHTHTQTDRRTDRQTDRRTDRLINGQRDT